MQQHLLAEDFQPVTTDEATAAALVAQRKVHGADWAGGLFLAYLWAAPLERFY